MVKTTITATIDSDVKAEAMPIIQNIMDTSLSQVLELRLREIIKSGGRSDAENS